MAYFNKYESFSKTYKKNMARLRKKKKVKKNKVTRSTSHSLFKIAAKDKSYKAAKKAKKKADARAKRAWKKAQGKAKIKLKKMRYC